MRLFHLMMMLTMTAMLIACGGEGSNSAGASSATAADIGQGLEPGQYEIDIVSRVRSVGPYSGDRESLRYGPSAYTQSRERRDGTGGRQRVDASNDDGPYSIMMRMDLQRGDEEPDRETGHVTIQLPPDAQAGQTYVLQSLALASHGEAYFQFGGYGQRLNMSGSGTIHVAEIGEHLSISFEFSGGDEAEDNYRHIRGRAYQIPLTRRGEAHYSMSIDGDEQALIEMARFRNAGSIMIGQDLSFNFHGEPQPGSFSLARRSAPGVIGVHLVGNSDLDISGDLELSREGDIWSASFRFEGTGNRTISADGQFDHLAAWSR